MINSCMGHASLGELGNLQNFSLNNLKKLDFGKWGVQSGSPCVIPGFQPPNLPKFVIPSIPLLQGLPPFPSFCLLPPFPGLPVFSLPPITIPIPPFPFIPPIPLPIPGFSLPQLPTLPSFDLGSLNFFCGLLSIPLPVLDPFASLNQLIGKFNAAMSALNGFANFCALNAQVIADTQTPPVSTPSISKPSPPTPPISVSLPGVVQKQNKPLSNSGLPTSPSSKDVDTAVKNTLVTPTDPASKWALFLANENVIPADPTIINKLAGLLTGLAKDFTAQMLFNLLANNNIPSAKTYIGWTCEHIFDCLQQYKDNLAAFIECLIAKGYLCGDNQTIDNVYQLLKDKDLTTITCLEISVLFNAAGIPFGCPPGLTLLTITPIDVARAFFLRHTTQPLTPEKIVNVLTFTGIIKSIGNNINNAIQRLTPLPAIVTPTSIANALLGTTAGPAVGSLRAACIALTQGTKATQAIIQIDTARKAALLQSSLSSTNISFFQEIANLSLSQFSRILQEDNLFPLIFPLSIWELIPLLSIKFDVDDAAISELLQNFEIPSLFFNIESLHNFISTAAITSTSAAAAHTTLNLCERIQESDFNYDKLVATITKAISKYNLSFPTNTTINRNIGNALQQELGYNSLQIINTLNSSEFINADQLTFLLLATGCLQKNSSQTSLELQGISPQSISGKAIGVNILSPTNFVGDINLDTLNITIKTKKISATGSITTTYKAIENGRSNVGTTVIVQPNDITQTVEITIVGISGFVPAFEAVESVDVKVQFATILNPNLLVVPNNYIAISF